MHMSNDIHDPKTELMTETENYLAWRVEEPDGEITYHLQLNNVTVHFFQEEWNELLALMRALVKM